MAGGSAPGPGEPVQQAAAAAASALVPVPAVCESCYLELDRGIRFRRVSAIYLWVEGEEEDMTTHPPGLDCNRKRMGMARPESKQGRAVLLLLALLVGDFSCKGSRVVEMESVRAVGDLATEFRLSRTHGDDQ